jgi:spore maturation protein CgeB
MQRNAVKRLKVLLAHVGGPSGVDNWYAELAAASGDELEVVCFSVTVDPLGSRLSWRELDRRWQLRDRVLLPMYQRLQQAAETCDVLLLYDGANVHPEFLRYLSTFNVYCRFDDPERSTEPSEPVAAAFDAVFYGNVASRFQYEQWGCKKLAWLPHFTAPSDVAAVSERQSLLAAPREVDIALVCEKNSMRRRRLEMLSAAFPRARCHGAGWAAGEISDADSRRLFTSAKIGWNVSESAGPGDKRTFLLAGFGVLQICDNKTGLGRIFALGTEAVGFDTIPEAIELTRYYLAHEEERQVIAAAGWRRYWRDYHAGAIWERIRLQLDAWLPEDGALRKQPLRALPTPGPRAFLDPPLALARKQVKRIRTTMRSFAGAWRAAPTPSPAALDERVCIGERVPVYLENPPMHGVNMARERVAKGEPFEWPNMLALNWAVTTLIREAKKIVDIGSGTGPFANFAAIDSARSIHCFEEDDFARGWAAENRRHPNVAYFKHTENNLAPPYDLLVSLDVIEHVDEMRQFLTFCSGLAPRAIFSTPNRDVVRPVGDMGPPLYPPHVREFDPGELYWILRQYYRQVALYHMPNVFVPWLEPMSIHTRGTPIIAECRQPLSV